MEKLLLGCKYHVRIWKINSRKCNTEFQVVLFIFILGPGTKTEYAYYGQSLLKKCSDISTHNILYSYMLLKNLLTKVWAEVDANIIKKKDRP